MTKIAIYKKFGKQLYSYGISVIARRLVRQNDNPDIRGLAGLQINVRNYIPGTKYIGGI